MSMSDVSDMLYEFYRANAAAKAPKAQGLQQPQSVMVSGATAAAVKYVGQTSPTSAETNEPSSIAAIATNGAASETASKNLQSDEMMSNKLAASFHPRIKLTNPQTIVPPNETANNECNMSSITAIPTSVVVPPTNTEPLDIKPIIHPTTGLVITPNPSVIKPVPQANTAANPQAAAIAAALIRDGYHSFQQQMRAQELMKFHTGKINKNIKSEDSQTNKILETFLRQQRNSECDNETASDNNDGDDEDDSRINGFEDIHLMEGSKAHFPQLLHNVMANSSTPGTPAPGDYFSDESQKYMSLAAQAQVQAFRNLEYSLSDFGNTSPNDSANMGPTGIGPDGEPVYECRHCGKKYRWKSTLRRHENVECGGKEPSHQCPYCPYKSKQRGNLGVHVRKHHSNLPQLASKRRSKYSVKYESNPSSANVSDDSNSKLIIDCSK
ncbi:pre-lola-G [Cochliomyia hominivorax]